MNDSSSRTSRRDDLRRVSQSKPEDAGDHRETAPAYVPFAELVGYLLLFVHHTEALDATACHAIPAVLVGALLGDVRQAFLLPPEQRREHLNTSMAAMTHILGQAAGGPEHVDFRGDITEFVNHGIARIVERHGGDGTDPAMRFALEAIAPLMRAR